MPNWCLNNLTITGDASDIAKFREWLGNEPFTLQKIKPMPAELEDTTSPTPPDQAEKASALKAKYGAADWYSWHIDNWGTKWDVEAEFDEASSTDDCLIFNFDSAWSPPIQAIVALGVLFPVLEIKMTYREDGMAFAGCLTVNGENVEDEYVDGGKDKEAYRSYVLAEWGDDPFAWEEEQEQEQEAVQETPQNTPPPVEAAPAPKKTKKTTKKVTKTPTKKTAKKNKAKAKKKKK